MNIKEIVTELKTGKTVTISAADAFEFMRECERHNVSIGGIRMKYHNERCQMRATRDWPEFQQQQEGE